jgi:anti-sigma regulatory factor (Ser/Thr protein kinase)
MSASAVDTPGAFSHEALFYAGPDDFAGQLAAFVREGVAAGEPVLVMVTADKIELLRSALGADADGVLFVDMAEAGRNPGRIISAWSDFARDHVEAGRRLRGIGEPIWADRSPDELVECQHHESLLNLAFGHADGFRLVCPYDTTTLPPDVIEEALRSHPLVLRGSQLEPSDRYRGVDAIAPPGDLPAPRAVPSEVRFGDGSLERVRTFVAEQADEAGLSPMQAESLVLAVSETAANSIRHGGGEGAARVWCEDATLVCEIRDRGRIDEPLVGRHRPPVNSTGGHGLWLAHQLCDLVQVRSRTTGTTVRLHMRLP